MALALYGCSRTFNKYNTNILTFSWKRRHGFPSTQLDVQIVVYVCLINTLHVSASLTIIFVCKSDLPNNDIYKSKINTGRHLWWETEMYTVYHYVKEIGQVAAKLPPHPFNFKSVRFYMESAERIHGEM
jgi:hypothetical protein